MLAALLAVALLPLLDDRPPFEDLLRFPTAEVAEQQLAANKLYLEHLESRLVLMPHHYWSIRAVLNETESLREPWNTLLWATRYGTPDYQRDMLSKLRTLLGPDAYYAGQMPPAIPVWRLTER